MRIIAALERQLENCINNDKEALPEQLRVKKRELVSIIEYKTKGAIIRSKTRWYNEGEEKKYILGRENRYCKKKTISCKSRQRMKQILKMTQIF